MESAQKPQKSATKRIALNLPAVLAFSLFRSPIQRVGEAFPMRHIVILSVIALAAAVTAAQAAPATIEGSWRGSGIVTYRNGADNVQCRVRYTRITAKSFPVLSRCATETGRYELSGRVVNVAENRYTGWVQSAQPNQGGGRVQLVQHGNRLAVTVTSRRGSAKLALSRG
jgi:hypothetical protein